MSAWVLALLLATASPDTLELSLEKAISLALRRNPLVAAATANLRSEEGNQMAALAGFLPQVGFQGLYTRMGFIQKFTTPVLVGIDPQTFRPIFRYVEVEFGKPNNYQLGLSVTVPLFTWGRSQNSYQAASWNVIAAQEQVRAAQASVRTQVEEAYYNALVARELLRVSREARDILEDHYRSAQERFEQGYISDLELLQAEVNYKQSEPQVLQAEAAFESALDLLRMLTGLPYDRPLKLTDSLYLRPFEADLDSLLEVAKARRADLRAQRARLQALEHLYLAQDAADKPSIFAAWNWSYRRPLGFDDIWGSSWNLSLGVQWNLFDGFLTRGQARATHAALEAARASYRFQEEAALTEIRTLYRSVLTARENVGAARENVALARRALEMAREQYAQGYISELDFKNSQLAYTQARFAYVNALKDYNIALTRLQQALEGGTAAATSASGGPSQAGGTEAGKGSGTQTPTVSPSFTGGR